jgi:uncharacterized protein
MYKRLISLIKSNSFFLFGARGTGKSTLIRQLFADESMLEIDLLDPIQAEEALLSIADLKAKIESAVAEKKWIFIDEVQKAPKLLDIAQSMIDRKGAKFIISGSSARKLKRGASNLLAGRAYSFSLFPLLSDELAEHFELDTYLRFGGLPHVWNTDLEKDKVHFLRSYVSTYLKEEIAEEQLVRKLEPFAKFLQVAAQSSGHLLNYSNIAKDVGVSDQTVKTYFQILEETLLGFTLPAFDRSIRKSIGKTSKFYLFDTGVLRALQRNVDQPFDKNHYLYGIYFEHFIIHEIYRLANYKGLDYQFSFIRIDEKEEIDLVIDRPGKSEVLVEIKSTDKVSEKHVATLSELADDFPSAKLLLLSKDQESKTYDRVRCLHWKKGIQEIFS